MAGNKLQHDQNFSDTSEDKEVEPKEEISDQPNQDEMRSRWISKTCQTPAKFVGRWITFTDIDYNI